MESLEKISDSNAIAEVRKNLENFTLKLNTQPNASELKKTPDGKALYLPIDFVETQLDEYFFGLWSTENFKWSAIANEVQGSIDLLVFHPTARIWLKRTGAASIIITVDKVPDGLEGQQRNMWALDPQNKKPNALDLAFPKLKTECIKNAASSLGNIFGRNINRKEKDTYKPIVTKWTK